MKPGKLRVAGIVAALLLCAVSLAAPAPVAGAQPAPPSGRTVTVTGTGTASARIALPEGAAFHIPLAPPQAHGWADVETSGDYAAIALLSNDHEYAGSRVNLVQVHLRRPWGCPAAASASPCLDPFEHVYTLTPQAPRFEDGGQVFTLPGGDYTLLLVGEPGAAVAATFTIRGSAGPDSRIVADGPARATFERVRDETVPVAAVDGEFRATLDRPGLAVVGLYHYGGTDGVAPGPFQYQECITRGESGALNPNDCVPLGLTGSDDVAVGGRPLLKRPQWFAGSFGGFSLTDTGIGTFESFRLEPGSYVNSYQVVRGGGGPAVGAWALWLELPPPIEVVPTDLLLEVDGSGPNRILTATLTDAASGGGLAGKTIVFASDGAVLGSAVTGDTGVASIHPPKPYWTGPRGYAADFAGDDEHGPSSATATTRP